MSRLRDVTRYVRSKNAGSFCVTVDIFFKDANAFDLSRNAPALSAINIAAMFDTEPKHVQRFEVPSLSMLKISFPRRAPQGGVVERDMHSGQLYVRLLELDLMGNDPVSAA